MGRAIAKISEVRTPANPKTTFTVGTVTGGTSVNAIAAQAELGLDMRSDSAEELKKLEANILPLMQQAADEENRRWEAKPEQQIKVELKLVGDRPAGAQAYESPVVDTARAASPSAWLEASIVASSTDSNLPISLGVPAAALGGGGQGSGSHSPGEWYQPVNAWEAAEAAADRPRIGRRSGFRARRCSRCARRAIWERRSDGASAVPSPMPNSAATLQAVVQTDNTKQFLDLARSGPVPEVLVT